jgi:hypothetical protein
MKNTTRLNFKMKVNIYYHQNKVNIIMVTTNLIIKNKFEIYL